MFHHFTFRLKETRELEELKKQLYEKNNELGRISKAINELCPTIVFSGRKLLDVDTEVNEKLLALKEVKAKREAHLRQLVSSARALDRDLGGDRLSVDIRLLSLDDLSQDHIDQVTQTIHNLTQTKIERQNQLIELIPNFVNLCNEIGEPLPSLIEDAISCPPDSDGAISATKLCVTEEAINSIKISYRSLCNIREQRLSTNRELADRIIAISRELPAKKVEIDLFLSEVTLVKATSHKRLQDKIEELLVLRKDHLKKELAGYRACIADLWTAVDCPPAERVLPKIRPEAEAGDDINEIEIALSQYREVYERLEAVRREREPIIQLIKTREEIIRQRDALEASTKDLSKYSSRSAADAAKVREEAELKSKIDRKLPANEKRLDELLKQWNENHGERFIYEGVDYLVKMKTDNENYKKHIEELKRIKKNQRLNSTSSAASSAHHRAAHGTASSNIPGRMTKSLSHTTSTGTSSVPSKMSKSTGAPEHVTPRAEKRKLDTIFEKSGSSPIPRKIAANKELGNINENDK